MRLRTACLALFGALFTLPACADTYNIQGDGSQLNGSLVLNSNGVVTSGDLTFFDGAKYYTFNGTPSSAANISPLFDFSYADFNDGTEQFLIYYLNAPDASGDHTLCAANAAAICSFFLGPVESRLADELDNTIQDVNGGELAPTPEPSGIILLGTALLGAAGVLRKRFA